MAASAFGLCEAADDFIGFAYQPRPKIKVSLIHWIASNLLCLPLCFRDDLLINRIPPRRTECPQYLNFKPCGSQRIRSLAHARVRAGRLGCDDEDFGVHVY